MKRAATTPIKLGFLAIGVAWSSAALAAYDSARHFYMEDLDERTIELNAFEEIEVSGCDNYSGTEQTVFTSEWHNVEFKGDALGIRVRLANPSYNDSFTFWFSQLDTLYWPKIHDKDEKEVSHWIQMLDQQWGYQQEFEVFFDLKYTEGFGDRNPQHTYYCGMRENDWTLSFFDSGALSSSNDAQTDSLTGSWSGTLSGQACAVTGVTEVCFSSDMELEASLSFVVTIDSNEDEVDPYQDGDDHPHTLVENNGEWSTTITQTASVTPTLLLTVSPDLETNVEPPESLADYINGNYALEEDLPVDAWDTVLGSEAPTVTGIDQVTPLVPLPVIEMASGSHPYFIDISAFSYNLGVAYFCVLESAGCTWQELGEDTTLNTRNYSSDDYPTFYLHTSDPFRGQYEFDVVTGQPAADNPESPTDRSNEEESRGGGCQLQTTSVVGWSVWILLISGLFFTRRHHVDH